MRLAVKLLALLPVLLWLVGCDIYRYKENQYRRHLERAGGMEKTVSLPAGDVRYWIGGDGPTVLLIHGFGGSALWQWHGQASPLLQHGARIIAPDLGWFGETVPAGDAFAVEAQVDLFSQLVDHLDIDRFDVVGISYGGFVALGMAVRHPERVQRLVLVDSPGPVYGRSDYEQMLVRLGIDSIEELLIPREPADIRRLLRATFYRPPRVPGFALKSIYRAAFSQHVEEKRRMMENVRSSYRDGHREYPTQQTLILWGEHDKLFPPELAWRLADALGNDAQVTIIPKAGHAANLERPAAFNHRLIEFLAEGREGMSQ
jgi:pimeloyl-ACP methyl ester carboxylesterase